jgi:predicted DNA-binding transcriptional regulator AlpA
MRIRSIRNRSEENGQTNEAPAAPTTISPKSALTEAEAAHYIGMSPGWLKKSRTRRFREIIDAPPFVRAGAKRVVYRRDDLDAWQERHIEQVGPASGMSPVRMGERGGDTTAESEAVQ